MRLPWSRRPAGPVPAVAFVTRAGCGRCAALEPRVRAVAERAGAAYTVLDVDADRALYRRFTDKVPVVLLDGREHAAWDIDEKALARALSR